jgi:hypothetical protein
VGLVALVAQSVPSAQLPPGVQLAGPGVKDDAQPAGKSGGVTVSKPSFNGMMAQGKGVGVVGGVAVGVAVGGGEGGGLGQPTGYVALILSMRQPVPAPVQSVARRKRKRTGWKRAEEGIRATVVTYPPELPVQACRPAMGLRVPAEIVPL